ncbi:MAG: hypothetical protein ACTSW1_16895 [Candidatus Hodarchaeales archaeon]
MEFPKVISVYSRVDSCGKKTLILNVFIDYAKRNPGNRIFIVDFSTTETLKYSLQKYGKSHFSSTDFLSEISDEILVEESLSVFEDKNQESFVRVLPSSGCSLNVDNIKSRFEYRKNGLFFRSLIDIIIFILPPSFEENTITMTAILESDMVWVLTTEKYPVFNLTKYVLKHFFTFLTKPILVFINMMKIPPSFNLLDTHISELEHRIRQPIFYSIPFIDELRDYADDGIYSLENPESSVNIIFREISEKFQELISSNGLASITENDLEALPVALFITDKSSGVAMFYYFFGKAEVEMKNPALITAALMSITQMVSETAGRKGDLHYIDNGNVKIYQRKGREVIGILYTRTESKELVKLLHKFMNRFENEFREAIKDFSKTGKIGPFSKARLLVEDIFEKYIFDIQTVSEELREKIIDFGAQKDLLHGDPEELFQTFVKECHEEDVIKLIMYEFTTKHNSRHRFLLDFGINPRKSRREIEEKTGSKLCECTKPPEYIQIQAYDALAILSLPEKLKPTARALFISDILSPETAAKITKRDEKTELECLEELKKLGYVRLISHK